MIVKITDTFNKILSVFSTFGISDALDIILVAVIIYICVRIIRETRAMQLAKGFIFIAIIYGIVNLLDMEASSFIFKAIFSNILIILVILFGPEVRNILEQIGKGTTAKSLKSLIHPGVAVDIAEISNCIECVCKACANMSDQRVGALICFENDTLLGNVIKSGTVLNAKASRELVENIFYPKKSKILNTSTKSVSLCKELPTSLKRLNELRPEQSTPIWKSLRKCTKFARV